MTALKTVRFSELVEKGGRPEVHLSWTAPARDSALQSAVKQNRVVTLHQQFRGTQKDFGVVGLELGKDVQFLIFPKSLKSFAGRRVVGIKYELFQNTEPAASAGKKPKTQRAKATQAEVDDDDRVIAFPTETAQPRKPSKPQKREAPRREALEPVDEAEKADDEDSAPPDEEQDPMKAEVRKALDALSAGRTAEAKRRLRTILES